MISDMSDRIKDKVIGMGILWEEAEKDILEFIDEKYNKAQDGIIIGDNENPKITKKMKHFIDENGKTFVRIRMNKFTRLADSDKIKMAFIIGEEIPDTIKIWIGYKDKPIKPVKICRVSCLFFGSDL